MHQVHTLNPTCVPTAPRPCARRRVVVRAGLYRGAHETVSWPPPDRVAGVPCRVAVRHVAGSLAISQHRPGRVAALYHDTPSGQAFLLSQYKRLYRDTLASQTARLSRYKDCIVKQPPTASPSLLSRYKTAYCDTIHQPGRARARCRPCRGLP